MLRVAHSIAIGRPREAVFEFVTNPENVTRWKKGLVAVRRRTPGPSGVGTIDTHVGEILGWRSEVDHEITEYEPNRYMKFKTLDGPFPSRGRFTFEDFNGGTRVSVVSEGSARGIYRVLAPLMAWVAGRRLKRDFSDLKSLLESE